MQPFALEQEYRRHTGAGRFDLSSSSPVPLSAAEVMRANGQSPDSLLDVPLAYERGGGDHALAAAIAPLYATLSADDIVITAGASEAIRAVAMACVSSGDLVAVQTPCYASLYETPADLGARVVPWRAQSGFAFDFEALAAEPMRDATSVFMNTPHGPSGALPFGAYRGGPRLIADEVYRPIALAPGTSTASVADLYDGAVSIGDLSKPLGLGGLRIGWIATRDRALVERCRVVLDYLSGSVATLSARIALAAFGSFETLLAPHLTRARTNLSVLSAVIEQHDDWLDWTPPQAGYTAFVRFRAGAPDPAFYERLRGRGIFALDGAVYGEPEHVRIGFGLDSDDFSRALDIFGDEVRQLPRIATSRSRPSHDVILLAKEPRPGFTKTRLATEVGAARAAEISAGLLEDSVELGRGCARTLHVSYAPASAAAAFERIAPDARRFAQPEGDLGARLHHAFASALDAGASRPILIGSDSPTLPSNLMRAAHAALGRHDVVLGPAEDGGYYLIGMNTLHTSLFEHIDWGGAAVLSQTLDRARTAGLRVAILPYWYDIDTLAGLARLANDPLLGRATRDVLESERTATGAAAS